ncbi:DEAD/DEAH box helicase [Sulfuriflexus mobilis]|uniref:DEAD/DEAH box helicase n=1 Tax=Sulfuriflexus mobilis TaxID=1811807 RepID=UPI000F83F866|nr:DEAD/DEAH box helicase [Sulfuriflexus mobilis]
MSTEIANFEQLALSAPILQVLQEVGYETPSPIQAECIPHLLAGHDVLGQAQTGTGKTAAFALPLLNNLDLKLKQTQVLVLAPTRELAIQVAEAFQTYARHLKGFHVLPIYGGQSMSIQLQHLKRGPHVIVGTPGRVMDHLRRKTLKLDALRALVLDEADEMLRMGFIDDVEWILEQTPKQRQIALFSATMPDVIRKVARKHLNDPTEIKIKTKTSTVETIEQHYWQVSGTNKLDALTRILEVQDFDASIIFVRTRTATVELAEKLEARGHRCAALNGDISQDVRERTVQQLKNKKLDIIIATDVAARGLDVQRISHVINYDIPNDVESYVHRIGRTGRAGRKGCAILFVAPREMRMLQAIERATKQKIERVQLPSSEIITNKRISQFKETVLEAINSGDLDFFHDIIEQIQQENEISVEQIAAALAKQAQIDRPLRMKELPKAKQELPRHRDERPRKDSPRGHAESPHKAKRHNTDSDADMVTYRIEVGRDDGVMPKNIVGAIANEVGLDFASIGHIKLYDDHSMVDLPKGLSKANFQHLIKVRVCHKPLNISLADGSSFTEEPEQKKARPKISVREDSPVPKKKTERVKEKWSSARKKEASKKRAKKAKEKSKEKKKTKK